MRVGLVLAVSLVACKKESPPSISPTVVPSSSRASQNNHAAREQFAANMSSIKEGMTAATVENILGPPDARSTPPKMVAASYADTLWRYGMSPKGNATLGTVVFKNQKVVFARGIGPVYDPANLPAENKLRELFDLLASVEGHDFGSAPYNPALTINTANEMWKLGHKQSLAVFGEYYRISSDVIGPSSDGALLVMLTLFNPKQERHPDIVAGAPSYDSPLPPAHLSNRFPILLEKDFPFLLVHGYSLAGKAMPHDQYLIAFRGQASLRDKPLTPPQDPIAFVDTLVRSANTSFVAQTQLRDQGRAYLMQQAVIAAGIAVDADTVMEKWPTIVESAKQKKLFWNGHAYATR